MVKKLIKKTSSFDKPVKKVVKSEVKIESMPVIEKKDILSVLDRDDYVIINTKQGKAYKMQRAMYEAL